MTFHLYTGKHDSMDHNFKNRELLLSYKYQFCDFKTLKDQFEDIYRLVAFPRKRSIDYIGMSLLIISDLRDDDILILRLLGDNVFLLPDNAAELALDDRMDYYKNITHVMCIDMVRKIYNNPTWDIY